MAEFTNLLLRIWPLLVGGAALFWVVVQLLWQIRGTLDDLVHKNSLTQVAVDQVEKDHAALREQVVKIAEKHDVLKSGVHEIETQVAVLKSKGIAA